MTLVDIELGGEGLELARRLLPGGSGAARYLIFRPMPRRNAELIAPAGGGVSAQTEMSVSPRSMDSRGAAQWRTGRDILSQVTMVGFRTCSQPEVGT